MYIYMSPYTSLWHDTYDHIQVYGMILMIDIIAVVVLINMQRFLLNQIFFLVEEYGILPNAYGELSTLILSLYKRRTTQG